MKSKFCTVHFGIRELIISLALIFLSACNNSNSTTANTEKLPDTDVAHRNDTIIPLKSPESYNDKIIGIWALAGMEDASLVIDKKKIFYPENSESFEYVIAGDSLKIKYDEDELSFMVKMKGSDTLILIMDEKEVFYRLKK